ncbi:MAG: hypothetical protein HQK76_00810 [Desulfobacterales bacterium]|nr:hypothetical protein [Desulfobacterales bacterium]
MNKAQEISSTEKLLNFIRRKQNSPKDPLIDETSKKEEKKSDSIINLNVFNKNLTIGIVIGYKFLTLTLTSSSKSGKKLLDYKKFFYDQGMTKESKEFPTFLKKALSSFHKAYKNIDIWTTIASTGAETRYLKIPKLPSNQVANAVFWTYKKEVNFNENETIFDYDFVGDVIDEGVKKSEIIGISLPNTEVFKTKELFEKAHIPLKGISIVVFSIQNLFRSKWLNTDSNNACVLFIGQDWSRIDVFSRNSLVLSRDIKTGMNSMIESIREEMGEKKKRVFPKPGLDYDVEPEVIESATNISYDDSKKIFFDLLKGEKNFEVDGFKHEFTQEDIFETVLPGLERLVRQMDRSFEHFLMHHKMGAIGKIYITGPVGNYKRLVDYIGEQLGIPIFNLDALSGYSKEENLDWSKIDEFTPSIGISLSNNAYTPNFIYTYKEKQDLEKFKKANLMIFLIFLSIMSLCFCMFLWQGYQISQKKEIITSLDRKLEEYVPRVDENMVLMLMLQSEKNKKSIKERANNYKAVALISELSSITPENIKLINLSAELKQRKDNESTEHEENNESEENNEETHLVILEGIVSEESLKIESALAGYLIKLNSSPLFKRVFIKNRENEVLGGKDVLRFTAQLEIN